MNISLSWGGYSGLYRNEDGEIEEIDNSLSEVSDEGDVEIGGEAAARARSRGSRTDHVQKMEILR